MLAARLRRRYGRPHAAEEPAPLSLVLAILLSSAIPALAGALGPHQETGAEILARQRAADRVEGPRQPGPRFATPRAGLCSLAAVAGPRRRSRPVPPRRRSAGAARAPDPRASTSSAPVSPTRTLSRRTRWARSGRPSSSSASTGGCARFDKATGAADGGLNADTDVFFNSVRNSQPTYSPRVRYDRHLRAVVRDRPELRRDPFEQPCSRRRLRRRHDLLAATVWTFLLLRARPRQPGRRHRPFLRRRHARRRRERPCHRRQPLRLDGRLRGNERPRRPQERRRLRGQAGTSWPRAASSPIAT